MSKKGKSGNKPKALTKSQFVDLLATNTGLSKQIVKDVLAGQASIMESELKAGRPVVVNSMIKVTVQMKGPTPSRVGINPFTKEQMTIKARPARKVIRVRALKSLKDIVG
jgi:nucleoid DNA-binding protein